MAELFRGGAGIGPAIVLPARALSASGCPNASVGRAISSGAATGRTIQRMGGNGDLTDHPVEKWDREAVVGCLAWIRSWQGRQTTSVLRRRFAMS